MANGKPRKRSKHLVVQDNPFRTKEPPKRVSPAKSESTGNTSSGAEYDNTPYANATPENTMLDYEYGYKISFTSRQDNLGSVSFHAFVDSVSESFTVNFQQTEKLGSPEPIHQYSGTSKNITLAWKAYRDDYTSESPSLDFRITKLKQMVYPKVDETGNPTQPPMVEMSYGPLEEEYSSAGKSSSKIFGYITSLSIDYSSQDLGYEDNTSSPRVVTFNIGFQPINRGLVGNV